MNGIAGYILVGLLQSPKLCELSHLANVFNQLQSNIISITTHNGPKPTIK